MPILSSTNFNIFNILGERFFVYEACLYECDPNAGLYRKFHEGKYDPCCDPYGGKTEAECVDSNCQEEHNSWEMYHMPI